jgi:hypothetical protein
MFSGMLVASTSALSGALDHRSAWRKARKAAASSLQQAKQPTLEVARVQLRNSLACIVSLAHRTHKPK